MAGGATITQSVPQPMSRVFGFDRGTPIDRYYIERFLEENKADIRGRVMEVGSAAYTKRFGSGRVDRIDVLHATAGNPHATIVGDLASGEGIPKNAFDCIVLTQVLPFVFDVFGAVKNCCRALKADGVVLATLPGISQISRYDMDRWGDFWRFTDLSARRLFEEAFGKDGGSVDVRTAGNVAVATSFLQGMALEGIPADELDAVDPDYQVIITVRARKGFRS
ncbi:MAG TPA: methyltransferase domain-containing protein, partial [Chloroflexota bacterium]|nr:methyltransferase domain-containing protein [Chloroflexota bacterium]